MDMETKLWYGAAYYLEYMPEDRLERDMELLTRAGFNLIRVAESAWSTWEHLGAPGWGVRLYSAPAGAGRCPGPWAGRDRGHTHLRHPALAGQKIS